jgi:hypothetical protein
MNNNNNNNKLKNHNLGNFAITSSLESYSLGLIQATYAVEILWRPVSTPFSIPITIMQKKFKFSYLLQAWRNFSSASFHSSDHRALGYLVGDFLF